MNIRDIEYRLKNFKFVYRLNNKFEVTPIKISNYFILNHNNIAVEIENYEILLFNYNKSKYSSIKDLKYFISIRELYKYIKTTYNNNTKGTKINSLKDKIEDLEWEISINKSTIQKIKGEIETIQRNCEQYDQTFLNNIYISSVLETKFISEFYKNNLTYSDIEKQKLRANKKNKNGKG